MKILIRIGLSLCMTVGLISSVMGQDASSVRIKVDIENATLLINGDTVQLDGYGNPLIKDAWFIVFLAPGEHMISVVHPDYPSETRPVNVVTGELSTVELQYVATVEVVPAPSPQPGSCPIIVQSKPPDGVVEIDSLITDQKTPLTLALTPGTHTIGIYVDEYEPLFHTIRIDSVANPTLNFLLRPNPPEDQAAEYLGMEYYPQLPMIDEARADRLRSQFNSAAETFAIVPLGQGLLAKAFLPETDQASANALVISGVVLTAGSYFLGKLLSKRKRKNIRKENDRRTIENNQAASHNQEVDRAVAEVNHQARLDWGAQHPNTGRVIVIEDERQKATPDSTTVPSDAP